MLYDRSVKDLLKGFVDSVPNSFDGKAVHEWFRQNYPRVKQTTIQAHLVAATVNNRNRRHYAFAVQDLLFRGPDGSFERYDQSRHGWWSQVGELERPAPGKSREQLDFQPRGGHGQRFEEHARRIISQLWGIPLSSRVIRLTGGVNHQFDLVSKDGRIVGEAKYLKDIPSPGAKLSVIAEYVWLLEHVPQADKRFIVFDHGRGIADRSVGTVRSPD